MKYEAAIRIEVTFGARGSKAGAKCAVDLQP